jgi:hypothetical protein
LKFPIQIDRYLAKLILVPLIGTLCLAAPQLDAAELFGD